MPLYLNNLVHFIAFSLRSVKTAPNASTRNCGSAIFHIEICTCKYKERGTLRNTERTMALFHIRRACTWEEGYLSRIKWKKGGGCHLKPTAALEARRRLSTNMYMRVSFVPVHPQRARWDNEISDRFHVAWVQSGLQPLELQTHLRLLITKLCNLSPRWKRFH
jgi:hypothetical protein